MQNRQFASADALPSGVPAAPPPAVSTAPTQPTITTATAAAKPTTRRAKIKMSLWFEALFLTLALLFLLPVWGILWYMGATFTIEFLARQGWLTYFGLDIMRLPESWRYVAPGVVTLVQIAFMPKREGNWSSWRGVFINLFGFLIPTSRDDLPKHAIYLGDLAFDVGSTATGVILMGLAGAVVPLFGGFTLPREGWSLLACAVAIGWLCGPGPERGVRWNLRELAKTWNMWSRLWTSLRRNYAG